MTMGTQESRLTYDLSLLARSAARWRSSPGLRCYYHALLGEVLSSATPKPRLELGSGIGVIREVAADVITSDVAATPYADRVVSAYAIETTECTWGAIVAVDVLHHLREPFRFFASAGRSLQAGGRLVLAEPAATPLGRVFYRCCHHEPCRPDELREPWQFAGAPNSDEFANMGMGWALFVRDRTATARQLGEHGLRFHSVRFRDAIAYPATGGFSKPQLLPTAWIRALLWLEQRVPQWLWRICGLRMIIVLEKV